MRTTKTTLAALAAVSAYICTPAFAADLDDPIIESTAGTQFYVSGFAGALFAEDIDTTISGTGPAVGADYDIDFDTAFHFGGAIGVSLGDLGLKAFTPRVELEVSYADADADEINFSGNGPASELNVRGGVSTTLVMVNAFADFNTGTAWTPYIGGGLGVGFVDYDFSYQTGPLIEVDDNDEGFAAQAIVGVSYAFSDNFALTLDARYTEIFDIESDRIANGAVNTGTVEDDYGRFSVNAGFRFSF